MKEITSHPNLISKIKKDKEINKDYDISKYTPGWLNNQISIGPSLVETRILFYKIKVQKNYSSKTTTKKLYIH